MLLFENADTLDDIKDWLRKLGMMTLQILTDAQFF